MNTRIAPLLMAMLAGLMTSPSGIAQEVMTTTLQAENSNAKPNATVVPSGQQGKPGNRYSKATLRALKSLNDKQTQDASVLAETSATQSPMFINTEPQLDTLREPLPLADASSRTAPFTLNPGDQALQAVDTTEQIEPELAADPDALGQESISATDRTSDKLKTRAITQGPLRLRLKDKGLRASVQFLFKRSNP